MAVTTAHVTPMITCFLVTRDFLSAFESACSYTNTSFWHTQIELTYTKRYNNTVVNGITEKNSNLTKYLKIGNMNIFDDERKKV